MRTVLNNGPIRKPSPFISNLISGGGSVPTPEVPTIGTLVVVSDTEITVPYTSDYPVEVWYSETELGTYTKHGDSASTPYAMTGLTQGTLYYVKIHSVNGSKYSAFGSAVSATTTLAAPTVLTSQFIVDTILGQVDFTDNSGGVAQHEVYSNTNGAGAVLLTTLAAGTITYNDTTCKQNASVVYTVRAKKGSVYSTYATATALVTPLCWKTDQSTRTNLVINAINISAGKTVNLAYGDGESVNLTGANTNVTHTYAASATNIFNVVMSGDINSITSLRHFGQVKSYGVLTNWLLPTTADIRLYTNNFSGAPYWTVKQVTAALYIYNNSLEGCLPTLPASTSCTIYFCYANKFSCSTLSVFNVGMTQFDIKNQKVSFPTAEIDKLLKALADWYQVNAPTANCTFDMSGANMGIPSGGASNVDLVRLAGYYTAQSLTATIVVRTS